MALTFLRFEKPVFGKPRTHFERVFSGLSPEAQKEALKDHLIQVHERLRLIDQQIRSRAQTDDLYWAQGEVAVRNDEAAA